ncbi:MAG: hypothetical protein OEY22_03155 [Candidatus Bathyarchaeota archaeon]|nr:hypothetical protein [Candidatus Bathyarchaeota archaeon]
MSLEKEIVSYLVRYGNTREQDLINFGVQRLGHSSKYMKKVIDRMVIKDKIHRFLHEKLSPPEVYISLEEHIPKSLIEIDFSKAVKEDALKILEEAAAIAEKRIRLKHPEDIDEGAV